MAFMYVSINQFNFHLPLPLLPHLCRPSQQCERGSLRRGNSIPPPSASLWQQYHHVLHGSSSEVPE